MTLSQSKDPAVKNTAPTMTLSQSKDPAVKNTAPTETTVRKWNPWEATLYCCDCYETRHGVVFWMWTHCLPYWIDDSLWRCDWGSLWEEEAKVCGIGSGCLRLLRKRPSGYVWGTERCLVDTVLREEACCRKVTRVHIPFYSLTLIQNIFHLPTVFYWGDVTANQHCF